MAFAVLPYPSMDFVPLDVLTADELDQIVANINAVNGGSAGTSQIADSAITTAKINDGAVTTAKLANGGVTPAKVSGASAPTTTVTTDYGVISGASTSKVMAHSGFLRGKAIVLATGKFAYISTTSSSDDAIGGITYYEGAQASPNIQVAFCVPVYKGQTIYFNVSTSDAQFEKVQLVQSNFNMD